MSAETIGGSATGSLIAYLVYSCIKKSRDKTKINGLLLLKGKSHCQENLSDENNIFIDMDSQLSETEPLNEIQSSEKRLNLYPKAKALLKKLKNDFRNKTIIICSCDRELLNYLKIKKHNIFSILPSVKMMNEILVPALNVKDEQQDKLEKLRLLMGLQGHNRNQFLVNNYEEQDNKIRAIFNLNRRNFI
jgi:hypothetical protein